VLACRGTPDQLELASECRELTFERSTLRSSAVSAHQRFQRAGRRRLNQETDRRQCVEEKVRVDLRAQRPQFRLGHQLGRSPARAARARTVRS